MAHRCFIAAKVRLGLALLPVLFISAFLPVQEAQAGDWGESWGSLTWVCDDLDGDTLCDSDDPDADADGFLFYEDAFPLDPNNWTDADGDGVGDETDDTQIRDVRLVRLNAVAMRYEDDSLGELFTEVFTEQPAEILLNPLTGILTITGTLAAEFPAGLRTIYTQRFSNSHVNVWTGEHTGGFACVEGDFGSVSLDQHLCGNYSFGFNSFNESLYIEAGPSRILEGDDFGVGPVISINDWQFDPGTSSAPSTNFRVNGLFLANANLSARPPVFFNLWQFIADQDYFGDSDGDGVLDDEDPFPLIAPGDIDTDSDGVGNVLDNDDDNDNLLDSEEALEGTDPLVVDTDGDGTSDFDEVWIGRNPLLFDVCDIDSVEGLSFGDLYALQRFLIGNLALSPADEDSCDLNRDAVVSIGDLFLLTRALTRP